MAVSNPDPIAKEFVKKLINSMFAELAVLSDSIIDENIGLLCEGGMSVDDRTISAEAVNYLTRNCGVLILGLLSNDVFRDTFKEAVGLEITLDERDEDFVKNIRGEMTKNVPFGADSGKKYVIDLGTFDRKTADRIADNLFEGLNSIKDLEKEFNELSDELTKDQAITIGFSISNFAYFLRAFSHNPAFSAYIRDVVAVVREELDIK